MVTPEGAWVEARGLKDRSPFTQWVVQQATYAQLQTEQLYLYEPNAPFLISTYIR